jgi:diphosphomevalonate decarboxylase
MKTGLHGQYIKEAIPEIPDRSVVLETVWRSPSNIALIKYWGKAGPQLPGNPSLSISLDRSYTQMKLNVLPGARSRMSLDYLFEGRPNREFEARVRRTLESLTIYFPFLKGSAIGIESLNTFPHSSGIASSASSMSALALCLCSLEEKLSRKKRGREFFRKASFMARLGSGSASRSVYGGFSVWGRVPGLRGSSDEYATRLKLESGAVFNSLYDAVLVVSPMSKRVSSSRGHFLMETHPFARARYGQARKNMKDLIRALSTGDTETFIRITESEALILHGLIMSSDPGYVLLEPGTLEIVSRIRRYREETGSLVAFTIDAGPNVHLLYGSGERDGMIRFIRDELQALCHEGRWIDDREGGGPVELNN